MRIEGREGGGMRQVGYIETVEEVSSTCALQHRLANINTSLL